MIRVLGATRGQGMIRGRAAKLALMAILAVILAALLQIARTAAESLRARADPIPRGRQRRSSKLLTVEQATFSLLSRQ